MPAPVTLAPVIARSPWVLLRAVTVADEVPPACTLEKAVPAGKVMRGLTMNALYMSPDVTCVGELLVSIPVRLTATGMVLLVLLLLPSWPAALLPQQ
jgi:hypothetical protein